MKPGSYRPDRRRAPEVIAALAEIAQGAAMPDDGGIPRRWADLLFDDRRLVDPAEASQSLLQALAHRYAALLRDFDQVPARAFRWYLEEDLGIRPLAPEPDRVVLVVEGDPKRMPVAVPTGTPARAGTNHFGRERLYATRHALSVTGATVIGAHSYLWDDDASRDVTVRRVEGLSEPGKSYHPFALDSGPDTAPAPHALYVASDLLKMGEGSHTVTLVFEQVADGSVEERKRQVADAITVLEWLKWEAATADGYRPLSVVKSEAEPERSVTLALSVDCATAPGPIGTGSGHHLRARFPEAADASPGAPRPDLIRERFEAAYRLSFRGLTLRVEGEDVPPQACFYNDSALDTAKEFEPFGPAPRRGDAFYVRLDEAFAKPLTSLEIKLDVEGGAQPVFDATPRSGTAGPAYEYQLGTLAGAELMAAQGVEVSADVMEAFLSNVTAQFGLGDITPSPEIGDVQRVIRESLFTRPSTAELHWEWHRGGVWSVSELGSANALKSVPKQDVTPDAPYSDSFRLRGQAGHFVRGHLVNSDFGWQRYLDRLARNVEVIANNVSGEEVVQPPQPDAPIVRSIRITYATEAVGAGADHDGGAVCVYAGNGLAFPDPCAMDGTAPVRPFRNRVGPPNLPPEMCSDGALYLGLDRVLPGGVATLYVEMTEADACGALGAGALRWEYCAVTDAGETWRELVVADSTLSLAQTGIVRFVTPEDWRVGARMAGTEKGHWLRVRGNRVAGLARVVRLGTDAVEARYLPDPKRPGGEPDPTPAFPLEAGAVEGFTRAIDGIKAVTNPAPSFGGRGVESPQAFLGRASDFIRHRGRAITSWDFVRRVREAFPQVALACCLPHTAAADPEPDGLRPGTVGICLVPRSKARMPVPDVQLAADVAAYLEAKGTPHLIVSVLCARYVEVSVKAHLVLKPGHGVAGTRAAVDHVVRDYLHPLSPGRGGAFGRPLYRSEVVRLLEEREEVDYVDTLTLLAGGQDRGDRVAVNTHCGLIASAGEHPLTFTAKLS